MRYAIFTIFLGALTACGSQQVKNPNAAVLQNTKHTDAKINMSAMFKTVNREELKIGPLTTPNQAIHYVNPGRVQIYAYVTVSGGEHSDVSAADYLIETSLKSGETYSLKPSLKGKCIEVYLTSSSGEKVGPFLQPWVDYDSPQRYMSVMSMEFNKLSSDSCNTSKDNTPEG